MQVTLDRVVCGFEETIDIFVSRRRFTSVDFPAFGATTAAKPERCTEGCISETDHVREVYAWFSVRGV